MGDLGELSKFGAAERTHVLEPEHLVGRGSQCSLRLDADYVSTQHALIRWNGKDWEVVDRGSLNGTHLNGTLLHPGRSYPVRAGDRVAFGHTDELWLISDVAAPEVMVVDADTGQVWLGEDGVLGIPSSDNPYATVYRHTDGTWKLEQSDRELISLSQGSTFLVQGRSYRFCCPEAVAPTATAAPDSSTRAATALFSVSSDEEFVEFSLEFPGRRIPLGSRTHNYMLLTLARARLADRATGIPETSCGWTDKESLADGLRMTQQQIDGEVFRVRKHLALHGLPEAAVVIERRPRAKLVRFGLPNIRIQKT